MPPGPFLLLPPLAFLLGSIPFGYLIYRRRTGGDIRSVGSGNIGATNVLRVSGKAMGLLTLALDAAKGWLALWLCLRLAPQAPGVAAAALLLVILGHLYSPWLRFRGGKGVATALGAFLALAPVPLLAAMAVFAVVLLLSRYVSLASIAACAALPLWLWFAPASRPAPVLRWTAVAAAALIVVRHHANLARLLRHQEPKLGARS